MKCVKYSFVVILYQWVQLNLKLLNVTKSLQGKHHTLCYLFFVWQLSNTNIVIRHYYSLLLYLTQSGFTNDDDPMYITHYRKMIALTILDEID